MGSAVFSASEVSRLRASFVRYTPMYSSKERQHYMVRNIVDLPTKEIVSNMLDGEIVFAASVDGVRRRIVKASERFDQELAIDYLQRYPDVLKHHHDPKSAYDHFVRCGAREGRRFF